jgi:hypothetical protein
VLENAEPLQLISFWGIIWKVSGVGSGKAERAEDILWDGIQGCGEQTADFCRFITVFPACSVHIGWAATVGANDGFSVINTAAKAKVVWVRQGLRQSGGVLHGKN